MAPCWLAAALCLQWPLAVAVLLCMRALSGGGFGGLWAFCLLPQAVVLVFRAFGRVGAGGACCMVKPSMEKLWCEGLGCIAAVLAMLLPGVWLRFHGRFGNNTLLSLDAIPCEVTPAVSRCGLRC